MELTEAQLVALSDAAEAATSTAPAARKRTVFVCFGSFNSFLVYTTTGWRLEDALRACLVSISGGGAIPVMPPTEEQAAKRAAMGAVAGGAGWKGGGKLEAVAFTA